MWRVDQIFLVRHGQRIEVICSLINDQGGLNYRIGTKAPNDTVEVTVLRDGRRVACTWTPFTLFDVIARWVDTVDGVQGGHACPMGNVLRAVNTIADALLGDEDDAAA